MSVCHLEIYFAQLPVGDRHKNQPEVGATLFEFLESSC
jgi:hypothetical protein